MALEQENLMAQEYSTLFMAQASLTEWNEKAKLDRFRVGLNKSLQLEVAKMKEQPETLGDMVQVVAHLDSVIKGVYKRTEDSRKKRTTLIPRPYIPQTFPP